MRISQLEWDDDNVEHIARHEVTPQEVEDICFGLHIARKEFGGRYILAGQSAEGRYLNVVIETVSGSVFRPVTAFEMSETYKKSYRRRIGK